MMENNIIIARYKGTGNLYKVLSSNCKMKNPETRKWMPAVIYQSWKILENGEYGDEIENGDTWIRELQDFNVKFELVLNL